MADQVFSVAVNLLPVLGPGAAVGALIGALGGAIAGSGRSRSARGHALARCAAIGAIAGLVALPAMLALIWTFGFDGADLPPPS